MTDKSPWKSTAKIETVEVPVIGKFVAGTVATVYAMTDHTDLLRQLRGRAAKYGDGGVNEEIDVRAADAIEALQKQLIERTAEALRFSGKLAEYEQHSDECQLGIGPPCEALRKAEADNAALRQTIESAHKVMHGDGVMDQGQAWDTCIRLLDAALLAGKEGE